MGPQPRGVIFCLLPLHPRVSLFQHLPQTAVCPRYLLSLSLPRIVVLHPYPPRAPSLPHVLPIPHPVRLAFYFHLFLFRVYLRVRPRYSVSRLVQVLPERPLPSCPSFPLVVYFPWKLNPVRDVNMVLFKCPWRNSRYSWRNNKTSKTRSLIQCLWALCLMMDDR